MGMFPYPQQMRIGYGDEGDHEHPVEVLHEIQQNPTLAGTISEIEFVPAEEVCEEFLAALGKLPNLVAEATWIPTAEQHLWQEEVDRGLAAPLFMLMLPLLPCIYRVCLSGSRWIPLDSYKRHIQTLVQAATVSQKSLSEGAKMLAGLREVRIDTEERNGPITGTVGHFALFATLPSVRRLRGRMTGTAQAEFPHDYANIMSNVEEIDVDFSTVEADALHVLLRPLRALRKLDYSFTYVDRHNLRYIHDWDMADLVAAIRDTAALSLEELRLTHSWHTAHPIITRRMGSFVDFSKLKRLGIAVTMLCMGTVVETPIAPPRTESLDGECYQSSNDLQNYDCDGYTFLRNVLPASLEFLELTIDDHQDRIAAVFQDFARHCATRMPRLRTVRLLYPTYSGCMLVPIPQSVISELVMSNVSFSIVAPKHIRVWYAHSGYEGSHQVMEEKKPT